MKIIPSSEEEKKPRMYFECYLYRKSSVKYDLVKQSFLSIDQRSTLTPASTLYSVMLEFGLDIWHFSVTSSKHTDSIIALW